MECGALIGVHPGEWTLADLLTGAEAVGRERWTRNSALMVTVENLFRKTPLPYSARNPYAPRAAGQRRKLPLTGRQQVNLMAGVWVGRG